MKNQQNKNIIADIDYIKGIYQKLLMLLPSFNITDKKILPYGLRPHTRSVSWLVEQVITQQTKYKARQLNLGGVNMGGSTKKFSSVHDNIGFFVKSKNYHFDIDAIRIPYDQETKKARTRSIFVGKKWLEIGYNPKDLWSVARIHAEDPEREAHPTQKPLEIIERMIKASCPKQGVVLDPFMGAGTTAVACINLNINYIGFEINADYCRMIARRIQKIHNKPSLFATINMLELANILNLDKTMILEKN